MLDDLRRYLWLAALLTAVSCSPVASPTSSAGAATPAVDAVATAVVATLTAIAPTPAPATATPAAAPSATALPPTAVATSTPVPPAQTPAPAATPLLTACSLAYSAASELFCLNPSNKPVRLAEHKSLGTLSGPLIAPDGKMVVYDVNLIDGTAQLWGVKVDGSAPHLLVGPDQITRGDPNVVSSPALVAWQAGTHTLFFNTRYNLRSGFAGPGEYVNNDLWKADADTGAVTNVLARDSVGRFALSPNGKFIALSLPQAMEVMASDGGNRHRALDFPAIKTYSEYAYKPGIVWSLDNTSYFTMVPSADPQATNPSATFYRIGTDGSAKSLGKLSGNFVFGGQPAPDWSSDGKHVVYGQATPNSDVVTLRLVNTDGTGAKTLTQQKNVHGFGWAPDSQHYLYAVQPSTGGFVANLNGVSQPFAAGAQVVAARWRSNTTFVYYAKVSGNWGLFSQVLGQSAQPIITGLPEGAAFDFR